MKRNKIYFVLSLVVVLVFFGCKENGAGNKSIKRWYYEDGSLKKTQEYIHDSIEYGTYCYYYQNGLLKDSAQITNNRFHGMRFLYFDNGSLYKRTIYFYDRIRSGCTFRKDGSLEYYRAYDYNEELKYLISFDSLENPFSCKGNLICSWILEPKYELNSSVNLEFLVVDPPGMNTKLAIEMKDLRTEENISEFIFFPDEFNRVKFQTQQNPERDILLEVFATMKDIKSERVFVDSLEIRLYRNGAAAYLKK